MPTISDHVQHPDGSPVQGATIFVSVDSPAAAAYSSTAPILFQAMTTTDSSGQWSLVLEPNSALTPENTLYEIEICVGRACRYLKALVPDASGPFSLKDIVVSQES